MNFGWRRPDLDFQVRLFNFNDFWLKCAWEFNHFSYVPGEWRTGWRRPSVEDDLQWKTTFGGRKPSVEDNLWWKMTFFGRWPLVEDDLQWKMTFCGLGCAVPHSNFLTDTKILRPKEFFGFKNIWTKRFNECCCVVVWLGEGGSLFWETIIFIDVSRGWTQNTNGNEN